MANPVFSRDPVFSGRARNGSYPARGAVFTPASVTGSMTYDDVIVRTGGLLAILVVAAAATWVVAPQLAIVGVVVGFILAMINSFKRTPSPTLIVAYALAEGVALGGISFMFQNVRVEGASTGTAQPIVIQAVLATVVTFAVALGLFTSGKVRVTPKFTRWLLIALLGYVAFSLLNLVLSFFLPSDGFGPLRNGWIGIAVGLVAVGMAAASLVVDFDSIKRGVERGAPKAYAWTASFGLLVTLVWLYLELLRLFAMLNRR